MAKNKLSIEELEALNDNIRYIDKQNGKFRSKYMTFSVEKAKIKDGQYNGRQGSNYVAIDTALGEIELKTNDGYRGVFPVKVEMKNGVAYVNPDKSREFGSGYLCRIGAFVELLIYCIIGIYVASLII